MKKKLIFTIGIIMTLIIIASAQTTNQTAVPPAREKGHGAAWSDADISGVCDNIKKEPRMGQGKGQGHGKGYGKGRGHGHGEGKGQGQGQGQGQGNGQGKGQGKGQGHGQGQGQGQGQEQGQGQGPELVDTNQDGNCDNQGK